MGTSHVTQRHIQYQCTLLLLAIAIELRRQRRLCGNESFMEQKFHRAKVPSMELSFPGAKVRGNESSIIRDIERFFNTAILRCNL